MNKQPEPQFIYLMSFDVDVGPPATIAQGVQTRRYVPIVGGAITGRLQGQICAGGGDWQTIDHQGRIELDAHYIADIADHGLLEVRSTGVRTANPQTLEALSRGEAVDPALVYFRTAMRFTCQSNGLSWLNNRLCISTGRREASRVLLDIYEVQ